ncbi:hypothetical protein L873DRAFT_669457 [Choiromyces venosus 120613-1]|uniref:Secreted protein n=1 Tax=Choiromyces venosus 120613-1 TaxID=1336337 RepID=A0A3N4K5R3_9PEZI|nr:hypothetical protein L873DRAFT_669457 [Choiromyces venosus 120613-1]
MRVQARPPRQITQFVIFCMLINVTILRTGPKSCLHNHSRSRFFLPPCFTRVELASPLTMLCCYLPVGKASSRCAIERQGLLNFFLSRYYNLRSGCVSKMVRVVSARE